MIVSKYTDLEQKRVVLKTVNQVHYAGFVIGESTVNSRVGLMIELDEKTGFSIFCPMTAIEDIKTIPIER